MERKGKVSVRLLAASLAALVIAGLSGCGGGGSKGGTTVQPSLQSISITPSSPSVPLGSTQTLTAMGTFSDGTKQTLNSVSWSSSASAVVTVSAGGLLTSLAQGTATITATSGSISGSTGVTITPPVLVSIRISAPLSSLPIGSTESLTAIGSYTDHSTAPVSGVKWASSLTAVASVDAGSGVVAAVSTGTTTLTATLGSLSNTATLNVLPQSLVSLAVGPQNASVPAGLTQQFNAIATLSDGSTEPFPAASWSSSDTSLATIDAAGLLTTAKQGPVTVTAQSGAIHGATTFQVLPPALTGITISPATATASIGSLSTVLAVQGTYTDHSTADVTSGSAFQLSNGYVAAIAGDGTVTGKRVGLTEVTATNASFSATARLTVIGTPRYAYFDDMAGQLITQAVVDAGSGRLRWKTNVPFYAGNPYSVFDCLSADPDQRFVYESHLVNSSAPGAPLGEIVTFTLDAATGTLSLAGGVLPQNVPLGCLTFAPSGKFAYASASLNNTNNEIASYSVNASSGAMTLINTIGLNSEPSSVAMDPPRTVPVRRHSVSGRECGTGLWIQHRFDDRSAIRDPRHAVSTYLHHRQCFFRSERKIRLHGERKRKHD